VRWLLTALDSFFDLAFRWNAFVANDEHAVIPLRVPPEEFMHALGRGLSDGQTEINGKRYIIRGNLTSGGFWVCVLPDSSAYRHSMMWSHICFASDDVNATGLSGHYQFQPAHRHFYVFDSWILLLALAVMPLLFVLRDGLGWRLTNLEKTAMIVVPGVLAFLALKWLMARMFRAMDANRTRVLTQTYLERLAGVPVPAKAS
jgi:hypothetical protein